MSTKYITMTEDDLEIIMKSSLSVKVDRCHLVVFYEYMCFLEYRFIGDNKDWFSSISDIEDYTGFYRTEVTKYIKCLEELGLLRVIREKYSKEIGKRSSTNRYKILGSTMNHGVEEKEKSQAAAEKPRAKKLKEQPAQPAQPEQVNKAIESQPGVDDNRANHEPKDPIEDLYLSAARKLKANGLTREITQQIKAKVKPNMSIRERMEIVCDSLYDYAKGLTDDEYIIATERISAAAYEEAVVRAEQDRKKKNRTLEELSAPDFKDEAADMTEVNDAVADFRIQEMEGMYKEAVA